MHKYLLVLFLAVIYLPSLHAQIDKSDIYIGMLIDFVPDDTTNQDSFKRFQEEIQNVVGASKKVHFLPQHILFSQGSISRAMSDFQLLSGLNEVDIILAVGAVSATVAADWGIYPKPTVAVGVLDRELQLMPMTQEGTSGVPNFTYALSPRSMKDDFQTFYNIHPFNHIAILISENVQEIFEQDAYFSELLSEWRITHELLFFQNDFERTAARISDSTDAAFLAMIFERDANSLKPLADALIERKIPSFSMGLDYLNAGFMAASGDENDQNQIFRKLALTIEGIVLGEDLASMPVLTNFNEQLYINANTARRVDLNPSFETLFSSRILFANEPMNESILNLHEIIMKGLTNNLGIQIEQQQFALAGQDIAQAKTNLFPTLDASANLIQVDPQSATASFGAQPERSGKFTSTLQQLIFSEQAFANVKIQKYLAEAAKHQLDQVALDLVFEISSAYFDILRAKTNVKIQEQNLDASRRNLEIARTRNAVGYAGISDVYRWESEVARGTQQLIDARNKHTLAKIQVNRILNKENIEEEFEVIDAQLSDSLFALYDPTGVGQFIENPKDLEVFTKFLTEECLNNHPALKQIGANQKAVDRQQIMNRRLFYLPTLALQGQTNYNFWRSGEGSEPISIFPDQEPFNVNNFTWNLGLNISYPIFQANQRRVAVQTTTIQQRQLNLQQEDITQKLRQNVRAKVLDLVVKSTNIHFAKISAESAQKSFDLVQDAYRKGQVAITQLVETQNASIQAQQGYANAVYDYLIAFIGLENSIGAYTMLMQPVEIEAFIDRLQTFFVDNDK